MRVKWVTRKLGLAALLVFSACWLTARVWSGQSTFNRLIGWTDLTEIEQRNSDSELLLFHSAPAPEEETLSGQPSNRESRSKWLLTLTPEGVCGQSAVESWEVVVLKEPSIRDSLRQGSGCQYVSQLGGASAQSSAWRALAPFLRVSLHAIQNGAREIAILRNKTYLSSLDLADTEADGKTSSYLLCETHMTLFDPYLHFLGHTNNKGCEYKMCLADSTGRFVAPAQFYVGGDNSTLGFYDHMAPQITLNEGTFANFGKDLMLFPYNAFWSLPMALVSPSEREQRHAWSLAVQYLMSLCKVKVTLFAPLKVGRMLAQVPVWLPNNTDRTLQFLDAWSCNHETFYKCLFTLADDMVEEQLITMTIKREITEWIELLQRVGYPEPHMTVKTGSGSSCELEVQYKAVLQPATLTTSIPVLPDLYLNKMKRTIFHSCTDVYTLRRLVQSPKIQFRDVLLIIVFNNPHYTAIPYLETLYRGFFPNILYCGPTDFGPALKHSFSDYSFVTYGETPNNHSHGAFNYRCLELAYHMRYGVSGYLVIADDLILNPWNVYDTSRSQIWYPIGMKTADIRTGKECRHSDCSIDTRWRWWVDYKDQVLRALEELTERASTSRIFKNLSTQLSSNNFGPYHVNGGYADIYYIPRKYAKQFAILAPLFYSNEVFLEIAVPTIINALSSSETAVKLEGYLDWYADTRSEPWKKFPNIRNKAYFHPWKLGGLNPDKSRYDESGNFHNYCQYLLKFMHKYGVLPNVTT